MAKHKSTPKTQADRYQLLTQMFDEVPQLIDDCLARDGGAQLLQLLDEPPADVLTLRLFLEFRALCSLLHSLSAVQLLHFCNNFFLPGARAQRHA